MNIRFLSKGSGAFFNASLCGLLALALVAVTVVKAGSAAEQLVQILSVWQNLRANITQTLLDSNHHPIQQSHGQIAMQRFGKFRWQTRSPGKQLLVSDGKQIWFYDQGLKQVARQSFKVASHYLPALLLTEAPQNLPLYFTVGRLSNKPLFRLTPKIKNELFRFIELQFSQNKLRRVQWVDKLGQLTIIELSRVELNPRLDSALFHFMPPPGVDQVGV